MTSSQEAVGKMGKTFSNFMRILLNEMDFNLICQK